MTDQPIHRSCGQATPSRAQVSQDSLPVMQGASAGTLLSSSSSSHNGWWPAETCSRQLAAGSWKGGIQGVEWSCLLATDATNPTASALMSGEGQRGLSLTATSCVHMMNPAQHVMLSSNGSHVLKPLPIFPSGSKRMKIGIYLGMAAAGSHLNQEQSACSITPGHFELLWYLSLRLASPLAILPNLEVQA